MAAAVLVCSPLAIAETASGGARRAVARTGPAHEIRSVYTSEFGIARPTGVSWDRGQRALVVTAATRHGVRTVSVTPGERLVGRNIAAPRGAKAPTAIKALPGVEPGAIARHPDGRRYVASADGSRVYALDSSGAVVRSHDLSSVGILDLQGMTFAPSSDTTDAASEQSLYIADRGDATTLGRVAEVSLEAAVPAANNASATLVATRDTSVWSPPSPDPSGIAYMPGADRFVVSDGEVDEMPIYAGGNLFAAQRNGVLSGTGTTVPWSNEPTGVAINPVNGHLLVSDDDKKSIFEIASPGADGRFGTADDGARTTFKTSTFGNTDPEDVGFDSQRREMLLIDGVGRELFRLNPGPNGVFNGVAPGGDDIATQYDVEQFGAIDPEGVAYDSVRDTVVVVDGSSEKIYELDANGSLISTIDIASASSVKAAGIVIAPASDGSGARRYYVVDRGLDNNSHPGENDGLVYELAASLPPITNRPPAVNAGVDQLIDLPETATLTGTAVDDGKPSNTLTYQWTKVSGPGTVTFGTASAATTTATFSLVGTYVLRFRASDGQLDDIDDMVVTVHEVGSPRTVQIPIVSGADDAMEGGGSNGTFVDLASADVEIGHNGGTAQTPMLDGLRFTGLPVPQNGEIVSAKIQFKVDETGTGPTSFTIRGEANDNAPIYQAVAGNISSRPGTTATVPWSPPAWNTIGDAGPNQLTPELKTIVQEVVSRPGWVEGNAVAFMINGTGRRTAEAKDGLSPPVLVLTFRRQPLNHAPVVNAGPDAAVLLPAQATLDGTVTDDGQPTPPTVTTTWTRVAGPAGGTVTFANAALVDTTATFSVPGSYTLRLTASDGLLSTSDDVVVAAQAPPTVSAGPNRDTRIPLPASLDGDLTSPGYPGPARLQWSKESGPGNAIFVNASSPDTEVTFTVAGTYVLRLTATNGAGSSFDEVQVTVQKALLLINLQADSEAVTALDEVGLTGTVVRRQDAEPVANEQVEVWVTRAPGSSPQLLKTVTTGPDGGFSLADEPPVNSTYQAKAGEDASLAEAVAVSPHVTGRIGRPSVMVGQRSRLTGVVQPGVAGQPVWLQRWKAGAWVTTAKTRIASGSTSYGFDLSTAASQRTRYRTFVPAYAGRAETATTPVTLEVYRVRITAVNTVREYVTLENTGRTNADLKGWTLTNPATGATRVLPSFILRPGRVVRIHSGSGTSDWNDVYLGRRALWGAHGTAVVRNAQRFRVDRFAF